MRATRAHRGLSSRLHVYRSRSGEDSKLWKSPTGRLPAFQRGPVPEAFNPMTSKFITGRGLEALLPFHFQNRP
jgi:hypothetical protein